MHVMPPCRRRSAGGSAARSVLLLRQLMWAVQRSLPQIDPYLNVDAGTMSPFEHGEVFVLDDGGEVRAAAEGPAHCRMGACFTMQTAVTASPGGSSAAAAGGKRACSRHAWTGAARSC